MKTTKFEQTIAMGIAEFIKFLERTLDLGEIDPEVSVEIFAPAVAMKVEIDESLEKYSETMLRLHGIED